MGLADTTTQVTECPLAGQRKRTIVVFVGLASATGCSEKEVDRAGLNGKSCRCKRDEPGRVRGVGDS